MTFLEWQLDCFDKQKDIRNTNLLLNSQAFGGVLAYGIMQMEGLQGLHGWQWIFILEGLPTLILAFACYFVLPDFPENAKCKCIIEGDIWNGSSTLIPLSTLFQSSMSEKESWSFVVLDWMQDQPLNNTFHGFNSEQLSPITKSIFTVWSTFAVPFLCIAWVCSCLALSLVWASPTSLLKPCPLPPMLLVSRANSPRDNDAPQRSIRFTKCVVC